MQPFILKLNTIYMKTIVIGDIHAKTIWKDLVANTEADKIVFLGDYFDTFEDTSTTLQVANFKAILQFKRDNPDRVVLLLGNHEYHYLESVKFVRYSGHQYNCELITEVLNVALAEKLIQVCYKHDKYLFSHAGVTKTWLASTNYVDTTPIDEHINDMLYSNIQAFNFKYGVNRSPYGDDIVQSPIWVRPISLLEDRIDEYIQVVGHTAVDTIKNIAPTTEPPIYLVDILDRSNDILLIEEDGVSIIDNIKESSTADQYDYTSIVAAEDK
jgi:hypothetical protein